MVEIVRTGRSAGELAREFESAAQAIRNWVARAERDSGSARRRLTEPRLGLRSDDSVRGEPFAFLEGDHRSLGI